MQMRHRTQSRAMIRRAIASRKLGSIRNILHGGNMSKSRVLGEDACPMAIIAGEEAFVAPNAVVYILIEDACFELPREWKGREEVHESLS